MAYDLREGASSLYRLDPDGLTTTVVDAVTISTGFEWSPDGGCAYYVDTVTGRIDVFDYDSEGGLSRRRQFAVAPGGPGGLMVDEEGGVWVTLYGDGSVRRYAPDRTLDEVVKLPVTKATACAFGGLGLDQLFITTSREHLDPGTEPAACALFTCTSGIRGVAVREFVG